MNIISNYKKNKILKENYETIQDWQKRILLESCNYRIDIIEKGYDISSRDLIILTSIRDNLNQYELWEEFYELDWIRTLNKIILHYLCKNIYDKEMEVLIIIVIECLNQSLEINKKENIIVFRENFNIKNYLIEKIDKICIMYPNALITNDKNKILIEIAKNNNNNFKLHIESIKKINKIFINEFTNDYFINNKYFIDFNEMQQLRILVELLLERKYENIFYDVIGGKINGN